MKNVKKTFAILAVAATISLSCLSAQAEKIGVIDLAKISAKYTKAQELASGMKNQEAEIQEKIANAQKKIQAAKSPVAKRNLEKKYKAQIDAAIEKIKDQNAKEVEEIDKNLTNAIDAVSKRNNLGIVINKQSVVHGGYDITDKVLNKLNK